MTRHRLEIYLDTLRSRPVAVQKLDRTIEFTVGACTDDPEWQRLTGKLTALRSLAHCHLEVSDVRHLFFDTPEDVIHSISVLLKRTG